MALQDILGSLGQGQGVAGGQGQPQGLSGQPQGQPGAGGGAPGSLGGNNPLAVAGAMGGGGIKKLAKSLIAISAELIKFSMMAFEVGSKEYDASVRALKILSPIIGDAKPADIISAFQSITSALPPSMQGKSPLEGLLGGGLGGSDAGAGAPPPQPPQGQPPIGQMLGG